MKRDVSHREARREEVRRRKDQEQQILLESGGQLGYRSSTAGVDTE